MVETVVQNTSATLRETVAAGLLTVSEAVHERVVSHFVEKETGRRADAIVRGLDQLTEIDRDLNRINRPDQTTFNHDGSKASETYSQDRINALNKARTKRDRLVKALDKALAGDMFELNSFGKGDQQDKKPTPEAE